MLLRASSFCCFTVLRRHQAASLRESMGMPFSFKTSVAVSALIAMMAAAPAWSQTDQGAPQDAAAQPNMLPEDIVVTAERRDSTVR
jgi:hypothetical protein